MSEDETSAETLRLLLRGLPSTGQYRAEVDSPSSPPRPMSVGGYESLRRLMPTGGPALSVDQDGLRAVDALIDHWPDSAPPIQSLAVAVGLFYGDVLTHAIPDSHWRPGAANAPLVWIAERTSVDVVGVARRRLSTARPTLVENFARALVQGTE